MSAKADRLNQPIARGTLILLNNRGILLVEDWDRIDQVCKNRLPGSVTGLRCGQQLYYITSIILAVVVLGYLLY